MTCRWIKKKGLISNEKVDVIHLTWSIIGAGSTIRRYINKFPKFLTRDINLTFKYLISDHPIIEVEICIKHLHHP